MADKLPHPKRPRDFNQLAHQIVRVATGEQTEDYPAEAKPVSDAARHRGEARRDALTAAERTEIARRGGLGKAARAKQKRRE